MIDKKKVKRDSFDAMWAFLEMGNQKSNYPALKDYCMQLRTMMKQKTVGQRKDRPNDINFDELDQIINSIVIEAMCLVLSGDYDN